MKLNLKYPPTPENASKFARDIVEAARHASNVGLDYSPESLELVDQIIEDFRKEGLKQQNIAETLFSFGCYTGEVFVKHAGGVWRKTSETPMKAGAGTPMVVELPNGNVTNPIGKVFKRFENGAVDGLPYFYHVFTTKKE